MKYLLMLALLCGASFAATPVMTFKSGDPVRLTAKTDGTPPFTFTWYRDGVQIQQDTSSTISKVTIPAITVADAGTYSVTVTNATGTASSTVDNSLLVVVTPPPAPPSNVKVTGEKAP